MKLLHLLLSLMLILPAAPVTSAFGSAQPMHDGAAMQQGAMDHDCCDGAAPDDGAGCCENPACGHCIVMPALPVLVNFSRPSSPGTHFPLLCGGPVLERQFAPPYRPPTA